MLGRREAWPALAILGVALVSLVMALKGDQGDMPVEPQWLMAVSAGLLVVLAIVMAGAGWRTLVALVAMMAAQLCMALFMGWGYSAVEGVARPLYPALQHGLWNYLPGTALQVGFAVAVGAVVVAWLTREREMAVSAPENEAEDLLPLPDLATADGPDDALDRVCTVPGVGGALIAQDADVFAAGIWSRDPTAALARTMALSNRCGPGLHTYDLSGAMVLVRWEEAHVVALTATADLTAELAHGLLRDLWAWELVPEETQGS